MTVTHHRLHLILPFNRQYYVQCFLALICCHICLSSLGAVEHIELQAPLNTQFISPQHIPKNSTAIQAQIFIPEGAPADLGVGACIKDDDGNWFQLSHPKILTPGHHHLHFALDHTQPWISESGHMRWSSYQLFLGHDYGLYFWSTESQSAAPCQITIHNLRTVQKERADKADGAQDQKKVEKQKTPVIIHDLAIDHINAQKQRAEIQCGERWSLHFSPRSFPKNPYDSTLFSCDLLVTDDQQTTYRFPSFYRQPGMFIDHGDSETMYPHSTAYFEARFRPKEPGRYTIQLEARWNQDGDTGTQVINLPSLKVTGAPSDPYVYVDLNDPRFFSIGKDRPKFFWPVGINIRSVTDPRGTKRVHSHKTPVRLVHAYKAYLDRLSLAGGSCAEIWLSSWNLALEWKDQWPGFHGVGLYNEANAERIDEILDYAWEKNIRIIFVTNNHGQASTKSDSEWKNSPYNTRNGGPTTRAAEIFSDPATAEFQQRYRRYLVGRYADHPAILCWKLWTEINLTQGSRADLKTWHQNAFRKWRELDHYYQHPCTTHWSGNYNVPDRNLVRLPEMDMIAIDAYHKQGFLPRLLYNSTLHAHRGLARYNKPVVVTEFGGNWDACPIPQLKAEHASGAWCALVSGHASSPHLWWFEWVDQNDYWLPFRSISNFITGEDLRGNKNDTARSVQLDVRDSAHVASNKILWARAWARSGCILGYITDYNWANSGTTTATSATLHHDFHIVISTNAKAGHLQLEWWNPQDGSIIGSEKILHNGGELRIHMPDFRRHLAFKLKRVPKQQTDL